MKMTPAKIADIKRKKEAREKSIKMYREVL